MDGRTDRRTRRRNGEIAIGNATAPLNAQLGLERFKSREDIAKKVTQGVNGGRWSWMFRRRHDDENGLW